MQVSEIDTTSRAQVARFLDLPFRLYRQTPQWVPPFRGEALSQLDRARNPFFRQSAAAFLMAEDRGRALGRLAVLEHRPFNTYNQEQTAFFCLFECENDLAAAQALFAAARDWAAQRGLRRIYGPKGFSPFDGLGLLVEGFQHRPAFGIPYNLPYYPALIEGCGLAGAGDIVSGYLNGSTRIPDKIHQVARLVRERRGLEVLHFRRRSDLRLIAPRLKELYNLAIAGTPGNYPISDEEIKTMADQLLRFADPRMIRVVMKGEEIVGFLFAYPDISAALQRSGGRLFPLGWAWMLLEMWRTRWANVNGMGIIEKYRGLGGTALLFSEMESSLVERGFDHVELVQIGAANAPMLSELREIGVDYYKVHRMYGGEVVSTL